MICPTLARMTQSSTPAGWYPEGDGERWWDGAQWSEHRRPRQVVPPQPGYAQPGFAQPGYAQPVKTSHTARNILIVFAVLFVLFVGGCFAAIGLFANKVNDTIDESIAGNNEPGGPNNPLTIHEGKAFEVSGFNYQAGWTISEDFGVIDIQGLRVENNRNDNDPAIVEIKFWSGNEVLALSNCVSEPIAVDTTVTLSCLSGDKLPPDYDKITINDSF